MARLFGDEIAAQCVCCEYWMLDFTSCSRCDDEYCVGCANSFATLDTGEKICEGCYEYLQSKCEPEDDRDE